MLRTTSPSIPCESACRVESRGVPRRPRAVPSPPAPKTPAPQSLKTAEPISQRTQFVPHSVAYFERSPIPDDSGVATNVATFAISRATSFCLGLSDGQSDTLT